MSQFAAQQPLPPSIPQQMLDAKRWLLWRSVPNAKDPSKKRGKVPYWTDLTKRSGALDGVRDQRKLALYPDAVEALEDAQKRTPPGVKEEWKGGYYAGLGFALGQGWQGVDLDGVRDPVTKVVVDWAEKILIAALALGAYVELSPSGKGFHILGHGGWLQTLGSNGKGVEAYKADRYFTFTGESIHYTENGPLPDLAPLMPALLEQHGTPPEEPGAKKRRQAGKKPAPIVAGVTPIMWAGDRKTVAECLAAIPAAEYACWIRVGMIIHHASGGNAEGLEIWDRWSQTAPEQYEAGRCEERWATFGKNPDKNPVGVGSLMFMADEARQKAAPEPRKPLPKAKAKAKARKPAGEAPDAPPDPLPKNFSLAELLKMKIPATKWLVEGLVAPGLTLLTAPPKQGKSYLSLQMGMCVSAGQYFLGRKTRQCRVTYFDLEEWHGLLEERVVPIMHGNGIDGEAPIHFKLETGTGDKALEDIAREIEAGSELVIVDLLARVRDETSENAKQNVYARDMGFMGRLADFALAHPGVALIVVHHANKGNHDDWQNKVSGSAGVAGAVHTNLYMARPDMRGKDDAEKREAAQYRVLHTNGKQVKEQEITLQMMPDGGGWATSDMKSYEIALTHKRKRIVEVLKHAAPEYMTSKEVAEVMGAKAANVKQMMYQMALDGIIGSSGSGGEGYCALI